MVSELMDTLKTPLKRRNNIPKKKIITIIGAGILYHLKLTEIYAKIYYKKKKS